MSANQIVCPHGIECDYVYTYTTIEGEQYVTGGQYCRHEPVQLDFVGVSIANQ